MNMMRTKSVEQSVRDTEEPEFRLRRSLGSLGLVGIGIGAIIGTGIFVLTGVAAATKAGPAIAVSFVVAGVASGLAALCYAEFASTVPVAGSAYTFSYASLGEFLAWIIGWDLMLEFIVGASAVSIGWSKYFTTGMAAMGVPVSAAVAGADGSVVNLPAAAIALALTAVLYLGIRLSSAVNVLIVSIKLAVVAFFIIFGAFFINVANWSPFVPPPQGAGEAAASLDTPVWELVFGTMGSFGFQGVIAGAALVFFAYIGFDIVASAAEETRRPQRDIPLGILGSLGICAFLYVAVSLVATGILPYSKLNTAAPLATAIAATGNSWATGIISLGAIVGLIAVILMLLLGQSRVAFAMSRDGLLPMWLARVHPRYRTPYRITLISGAVVAVIAAFTPIVEVAELVNIGTLFAFILVAVGVITLRRTRPELHRAFRVPGVPLVPIIAVLVCLYLMLNLAGWTWIRLLVWLGAGLIIYFAYGIRNSRLARGRTQSISTTYPP
ncbi:MAG: amino acid permease [Actinomycetota bacterium]|nr:amino acid permease [Actinomycetota bacterium]